MTYLPCVGCGWCCLHDQCDDSMRRYGYKKRCPELRWDEEHMRYLCQAMGGEAGRKIRYTQHAGKGCCAPCNTWRSDVRNREEVL